MFPLYLRVPSKRVAMVSRKVFWGARRPFITGILTQMWDGQQLARGHTIPGSEQGASRGRRQGQETLKVKVRCRSRGHTFTEKAATLLPSDASPKKRKQCTLGTTEVAHAANEEVQVWTAWISRKLRVATATSGSASEAGLVQVMLRCKELPISPPSCCSSCTFQLENSLQQQSGGS